jgi:hypothetical protein
MLVGRQRPRLAGFLESAQAAASAAAGRPLQWIPDPGEDSTWNTLSPDDWMIREVELHGELSLE